MGLGLLLGDALQDRSNPGAFEPAPSVFMSFVFGWKWTGLRLALGLPWVFGTGYLITRAARAWIFPPGWPAIGNDLQWIVLMSAAGLVFVMPTAAEFLIVQAMLALGVGAGPAFGANDDSLPIQFALARDDRKNVSNRSTRDYSAGRSFYGNRWRTVCSFTTVLKTLCPRRFAESACSTKSSVQKYKVKDLSREHLGRLCRSSTVMRSYMPLSPPYSFLTLAYFHCSPRLAVPSQNELRPARLPTDYHLL
jgi:hypothetical protein